ncbi:MAG: hypothetical protein HAW67_05825 [Endozoicomonadaceae bacterium]|nr:hypothetical protein [Endozoicomonadaceae bacterium]
MKVIESHMKSDLIERFKLLIVCKGNAAKVLGVSEATAYRYLEGQFSEIPTYIIYHMEILLKLELNAAKLLCANSVLPSKEDGHSLKTWQIKYNFDTKQIAKALGLSESFCYKQIQSEQSKVYIKKSCESIDALYKQDRSELFKIISIRQQKSA